MDMLILIFFVVFAVIFVAFTPGDYRPRASR